MEERETNPEGRHMHPLLSGSPAARARKGKVVSAEEAVRVIRDGDTVATGGFCEPPETAGPDLELCCRPG